MAKKTFGNGNVWKLHYHVPLGQILQSTVVIVNSSYNFVSLVHILSQQLCYVHRSGTKCNKNQGGTCITKQLAVKTVCVLCICHY